MLHKIVEALGPDERQCLEPNGMSKSCVEMQAPLVQVLIVKRQGVVQHLGQRVTNAANAFRDVGTIEGDLRQVENTVRIGIEDLKDLIIFRQGSVKSTWEALLGTRLTSNTPIFCHTRVVMSTSRPCAELLGHKRAQTL